MNFKDEDIVKAGEVSKYLMHLSREFPQRWNAIVDKNEERNEYVKYPFGDMAYGAALVAWEKAGKPENAAFSYAENNTEDPFLIEFREELEEKFGLRILSIKDGKARMETINAFTKRVYDWGLN